jgi:hypothetical protein
MKLEASDVSNSFYDGYISSNKNYSFLGKDHVEIRKFDGSNFALWKNQMRDVLVQPRQTRRPLGGKQRNQLIWMTMIGRNLMP